MNDPANENYDPNELYGFYKQARNYLTKFQPMSVLTHAIKILHKTAYGGFEIMRIYQPWNALLLVRWTLQSIDPVAHRRPAATLNDVHKLLNIIHEMEGHVRMPNEYEHPYLFMRHLGFQQFWLQRPADRTALARQQLLFCKLPKNHQFQCDFLRLTGMYCNDFTELAFSLMVLFLTNPKPYAVRAKNFSNLETKSLSLVISSFLPSLSLNLASAHNLLTSAPEKECSISDQILLPTPLLHYPLLHSGEDFIAYSPTLLFRSLEDFIYRRLKKDNKGEFSSKFGPVFERYVGECLSEAGVSYQQESSLNEILNRSGNYGKCVDFLIIENECNILIDAKGIEISNLGLLSHRADIVFRSLKESAGKAIKQGMDTRRRIANTPASTQFEFGSGPTYLIVVTFDALHLGSNTEFEKMFGTKVMDSYYTEFGNPLPIPITNIFFITIDEWEWLLEGIRERTMTFETAIKHAQQNDSGHGTRKFSFTQHLEELLPERKQLPSMIKALDDLCERSCLRIRKMPSGLMEI